MLFGHFRQDDMRYLLCMPLERKKVSIVFVWLLEIQACVTLELISALYATVIVSYRDHNSLKQTKW